MVKRFALLALAALGACSASGCVLGEAIVDTHNRWASCYRQTHWMDCSCGEFYWSEWFNDPPACCDTCNQCGEFVGPQPCLRAIPNWQRGYIYRSRQLHNPFVGPPPSAAADYDAPPDYTFYRDRIGGPGPHVAQAGMDDEGTISEGPMNEGPMDTPPMNSGRVNSGRVNSRRVNSSYANPGYGNPAYGNSGYGNSDSAVEGPNDAAVDAESADDLPPPRVSRRPRFRN